MLMLEDVLKLRSIVVKAPIIFTSLLGLHDNLEEIVLDFSAIDELPHCRSLCICAPSYQLDMSTQKTLLRCSWKFGSRACILAKLLIRRLNAFESCI